MSNFNLTNLIMGAFISYLNGKYSNLNAEYEIKAKKDGGFSLSFSIAKGKLQQYFSETSTGHRESNLDKHPQGVYYSEIKNKKNDVLFRVAKKGVFCVLNTSASQSSFSWWDNGQVVTLSLPEKVEECTLELAFIDVLLQLNFGVFDIPELTFTETVNVRKGLKMVSETINTNYKIFDGKIYIENIELDKYTGNLSDAFLEHLQTLPEFSQYE